MTTSCNGSCGESSVDPVTRPTPKSALLNFYVPSSTRKYKRSDIPTVGYTVCGDIFTTKTTTSTNSSATATVYRGQPFVVTVPADATGPILYLTVGTSQQAIDLAMPGTRNGVTVSPGASNASFKTFTITVN